MAANTEIFTADFFDEHTHDYDRGDDVGLGSLPESLFPGSELDALKETFTTGLSIEGISDLEMFAEHIRYPRGTVLVKEGRPAARAILLQEGEVTLSTTSPNGRRLNLGKARPGEILGLECVIIGDSSKIRAEALSSCRVVSLRRLDFLAVLMRNPSASQSAARDLARSYARLLHVMAQQRVRCRWVQA